MERIKYQIEKCNQGISIRKLLENFYVGKSSIYKLFFNKQIYVNDSLIKEDYILKLGDELEIDCEEDIDFLPWDKTLDVVYEDNHLLIVNKPVGVIIHPDGKNVDHTLVNMVASYYKKNGIKRNVRYIHRIDTETSGIVVFAKDFLTYNILSHQIETHEIKREYLALVSGTFKDEKGRIDAPIGRDRHVQNKFRVGKSTSSKEAITNYYVIRNFKDYSYIRLVLETGRTHQIRVHMASINHPLLGDSLYGGKKDKINRVSLHSFRVILLDPYTHERLVVETPLPKDMDSLVSWSF